SFPTRRSSDLWNAAETPLKRRLGQAHARRQTAWTPRSYRSDMPASSPVGRDGIVVERNPRIPGGKYPRSLPLPDGSPQLSRQPRWVRLQRPRRSVGVLTPRYQGAVTATNGRRDN